MIRPLLQIGFYGEVAFSSSSGVGWQSDCKSCTIVLDEESLHDLIQICIVLTLAMLLGDCASSKLEIFGDTFGYW